MNSPQTGLRVAAVIFGVVCLAHLWRVLSHVEVDIGRFALPMWLSVAGVFVSGGLSTWLWRLSAVR